MKVQFHLVVNKNGSVKAVKNRPNMAWDEIAIMLTLQLPDMLFKKPMLSAEVTIPDKAAIPNNITAEVKNNIKDSIEAITGMDVSITVVNPE